jgi:hypothetical protein
MCHTRQHLRDVETNERRSTAMGIFDKAKDLVSEHSDQIADGIEKAADLIEDKVPDQYDGKVDQAADKLSEVVRKLD